MDTTPTQYDVEDLPGLGALHFYEVGGENHYFTIVKTGKRGFVKFG
jgi:hypothetical protein